MDQKKPIHREIPSIHRWGDALLSGGVYGGGGRKLKNCVKRRRAGKSHQGKYEKKAKKQLWFFSSKILEIIRRTQRRRGKGDSGPKGLRRTTSGLSLIHKMGNASEGVTPLYLGREK